MEKDRADKRHCLEALKGDLAAAKKSRDELAMNLEHLRTEAEEHKARANAPPPVPRPLHRMKGESHHATRDPSWGGA